MMKLARLWLIAGLAASSAACACRPVPPEVIDMGCYTYAPIYPTLKDTQVISPQLVQQLLTHNEKFKRNCMENDKGS